MLDENSIRNGVLMSEDVQRKRNELFSIPLREITDGTN